MTPKNIKIVIETERQQAVEHLSIALNALEKEGLRESPMYDRMLQAKSRAEDPRAGFVEMIGRRLARKEFAKGAAKKIPQELKDLVINEQQEAIEDLTLVLSALENQGLKESATFYPQRLKSRRFLLHRADYCQSLHRFLLGWRAPPS